MLEPKDFCTTETIEHLQSVGITVDTDRPISLYEAQKLLRKQLRVFVDIPLTSYLGHFNPSIANYKVRIYMVECPITSNPLIAYSRTQDGSCYEFVEYEDALQFGIQSACKSYKAMRDKKSQL